MNDYKEIAMDILEEVCETDEVREDADLDLLEAGLLDSLAVISIILSIEKKMNIKLQPTDFEKKDISTVNNLAAFLEKKGE